MTTLNNNTISELPRRLAEARFLELVSGGIGKSFRGSITDYCRTISLGPGYIGKWREKNLCRNCSSEIVINKTTAVGASVPGSEFRVHGSEMVGRLKVCNHFEIDTCRQLAGPFAAIEDPNVRLIILQKAAQTAGSLTWDMAVHYLLVHSRYMRIKIYFCDSDEKAERYCNERLMDTLKANPDIKPLLPTGAMRFENKQAEIKLLNGKHIVVFSLNDTNASSLPGDVIIIDEAWLAKPGLIQKAIDRTKQQSGSKIIIVSQAGEKGCDMDTLWTTLHKRVPLTWACPCCGGRQEFQLPKKREEGFVARPPQLSGTTQNPEPGTLTAQLPLPPAAGTIYGFKLPKKISELGTNDDIKAACAQTVIECYWCGFEIHDTWEMRQALQATYEQEYKEVVEGRGSRVEGLENGGPTARFTPENYSVGFWNPDPSSVFVPFRETMEAYVNAVKTNDEKGNIVPLRDFYLARWAQAWDPLMTSKSPERPGASIYEIDPKKKFPGELVRISATDIQFQLTHMVYLAVAVGDGTPPVVLHYEWVKPDVPTLKPLVPYGEKTVALLHGGLETDVKKAEFCKARVRELDKHFEIQQQNSMKDAAHEPGLVREWAAEDAVWAKMKVGSRIQPGWVAYGLLLGDDRMSYRWNHPGRRDTWERFKQYQWHKVEAIKDGRRVKVDVHHRLWSNPSIKEIAERWRDGLGAPKLQIHEQWLRDNSKDGLWSQLTSERKIPWKGHPGKLHYNNEGRPNHAWDAWCMIVVRMDELGLLNSFGPPPEDNEN